MSTILNSSQDFSAKSKKMKEYWIVHLKNFIQIEKINRKSNYWCLTIQKCLVYYYYY